MRLRKHAKREDKMNTKPLKELVNEEVWQQCFVRLKEKEALGVLHELFDYIVDTLARRIDDIKTDDGRAISFFSKGREILTINVTRKDLRIYIHPPARAFFDPKAKFSLERFRFWEGSYQKASGRYRAMSVWVSQKKYLPGAREIINYIPKTTEEVRA